MSQQLAAMNDPMKGEENPAYLSEQIITYIGNKRALLGLIGQGVRSVRERLGGRKLSCLDAFSGSGIVSRMLKQHATELYVNDLEDYARTIATCYLANAESIDKRELAAQLSYLQQQLRELSPGFITELYAPADDNDIRPGERAFYTRRNAMYLDSACRAILTLPADMQAFFLAPLLCEASVHTNTAGVFKGFYKNRDGIGQFGGEARNALSRILTDIELKLPIFSRYQTENHIFQAPANELVQSLPELDLAYLDPPYNQHPYGSNYFMLNLVANYKRPEQTSTESGIPRDWNRSAYNRPQSAQAELFQLVQDCPARFILISYNSEGFVKYENFISHLQKLGKVTVLQTEYNTFRGCRNLRNRDIKVTEFLFLLEKK